MKKKKNKYLIILILILFNNFIQGQNKNHTQEKNTFILSKTVFNINGISLNNNFNLSIYIDKIGKPDKVIRGGQKIIDEFGFDDYELSFSKNRLVAGHGYLLNAYIFEKGISFNGIEVGNNREKIERTFNIETFNQKSISLISINDHHLQIELSESGIIIELIFSSPIWKNQCITTVKIYNDF